MIGGGGIGASPMVRPFYNRAASAPAPPAITRTVIGKDSRSSAGGVSIVGVAGVSLAVGDTVIMCLGHLGQPGGTTDAWQVSVDGDPCDLDLTNSFGDYVAEIWSYRVPFALSGITIQVDYSTSINTPYSASVLIAKVTGLNQTFYLDKINSAAGGPSGTQDSGLTGVTTNGAEFVQGMIVTNGVTADTIGTWQASLTAGQNGGSSSALRPLVVKEGFRITTVTGTQRAQVTGATSRTYAANVATYNPA